MKPSCLKHNRLFIIAGLLLTFACTNSVKQPPIVDRSKLTEEEKRLPENALSSFTVADGLQVEQFANESRMTNPTNMDIDARGRVWLTEGYNYRFNLNAGHTERDSGDRILILEDTNGDGKADTSKVFYQDTSINAALGIAVLGNKVIVSCSPNVFILTDTDGDDKADKKELLFTGIAGVQHDHAVHAFTFGPDGKLYFNFGNAGDSILDKNGQAVKDPEGIIVQAKGKPYRQGMIFRCNMDGSNFEVLANNFRNNYEVAVDAFGNMWQSDNDDDGNRGVRINYILEYGNYGYTDEMTGAGWQSRRTNMEDSIPLQHWHLNDPGVVPNLLQTGSGSPTGMLVYEGNMLPSVFQGQMIHAEPGHNVVRSYPVKKDGAGYEAKIVNILEAKDDNWFRPSDVCVAPDGSLFIADWYDPGVGGHQVRDLERGRVYRVAPDVSTYKVPAMSLNDTKGAIQALESPNLATRYLAWEKLHTMGAAAEKDLAEVFEKNDNPRYRARAFWLLTKIPGKSDEYIKKALADKNEDIRIAAFKAARENKADLITMVKEVVNDQSPQIRREALIALRHSTSPDAPGLWADFAGKYDGKDRWYLEALGVAADKQWDTYFGAWLQKAGVEWNSGPGRDIVWRSRAASATPMLAKLIEDPANDPSKNLRYFRAFDFHADSAKQQVLMSLLNGSHPQQKMIAVYALAQLDTNHLAMTPELKSAITSSLDAVKGTPTFVDLVAKYKIKDQNEELLKLAIASTKRDVKSLSVRLIMMNNGANIINKAIHTDTATAKSLINALGGDENDKTKDLLQAVMLDKNLDLDVRKRATQGFYRGFKAQQRLMDLVLAKKLPADLDTTAEKMLLRSNRPEIKDKAMAFYHKEDKSNFVPIPDLIKLSGNVAEGKTVFGGTCATCHQVNNNGINFGPDLSEIGAKLPKEGLYDAVLHPDAGISFGFEGFIYKLKDGNQLLGYVTSDTKDELAIKSIGGSVTRVKKADIVSKKAYDHSLMPTGLVNGMKQQQVVDLVEYLAGLKKKG